MAKSSPLIRPLEPSDRESLRDVLCSDGTFTADEAAVALELIDDAIANPASDYWVRIAVFPEAVDSGIGGYICYGPTPMTDSTYDLYWIVTHAEARGRGVASALVRAMETDLGSRGATGVRVETSVKESHGAARRLYAALDYPETARFADFYSRGDDLIVYYKQF